MYETNGRRRRGPATEPAPARSQQWMTTTESGERRLLEEMTEASGDSAAVRALAVAIARRLSVRPRRRGRSSVRGAGELLSVLRNWETKGRISRAHVEAKHVLG